VAEFGPESTEMQVETGLWGAQVATRSAFQA